MAGCLEFPSSLKRTSLSFSLIPKLRCLRMPDQLGVPLCGAPTVSRAGGCLSRVAENQTSERTTMGARARGGGDCKHTARNRQRVETGKPEDVCRRAAENERDERCAHEREEETASTSTKTKAGRDEEPDERSSETTKVATGNKTQTKHQTRVAHQSIHTKHKKYIRYIYKMSRT